MDLWSLRSLVTLAKTNSITKAAELLHLSPAAIHKQLKNLESALETRLYERVGRRLRLTAAAQMLLPHATDLLLRHQAMLSAFQEWKGLKAGTVRLGTGPATSTSILPSLLAQFRISHPDVEVVVETGNTTYLIEELSAGNLDLAIMLRPSRPESDLLSVKASWTFELVLVTASQELPRRCSIRDLASVPFIVFKVGSQLGKAIDSYMASLDFHPRVVMRFDSAEAIKAVLRIGAGVSMLPAWSVVHEIREGSLALIVQTEPPLRSQVILAVRRGSYLAPAASALIELARQRSSLLPNGALTGVYAAQKPQPDRLPG